MTTGASPTWPAMTPAQEMATDHPRAADLPPLPPDPTLSLPGETGWRREMHAAAVALAIPGWVFDPAADIAGVTLAFDPGWDQGDDWSPPGIAVHVHVHRPAGPWPGLRGTRTFRDDDAARFMDDLMAAPAPHQCADGDF